MFTVKAYTDGSCEGNPGPGGIGSYIKRMDRDTKNVKRVSKGFAHTTNNEMELLAILLTLMTFKEKVSIEIHTDSQYSINCICVWSVGWAKRGWTKPGGPIQNLELIKAILHLCKFHRVTFKKVKAHNGDFGNETADKLAKEGVKKLMYGRPSSVEHYIKKAYEFII